MPAPDEIVHLTDTRTSVVVDTSIGAAQILHWGAPLGDVELTSLRAAMARSITAGGLDAVAPVSLVPEHGAGFLGHPGLSGRRRDGGGWAPRFTTVNTERGEGRVTTIATDPIAGLELRTTIELHPSGVVRARAEIVNVGDDGYALDELSVTLPLPQHAAEVITFHGRWCRELHPVRRMLDGGSVVSENRSGRTSHEKPPIVWAGSSGFGEGVGEVWGCHLAWSGDARLAVERLADGRRLATLGELLMPGEVTLAPGGTYTTPWIVAAYAADGLTTASRAFHRYARLLPAHRASPRPVLLNTWEAVYFRHDRDTLLLLAERAASVGVERFVLDDGWFGDRRDDRRGLGDWTVSPVAHPDGLAPLIARVRALGMDFGLWVEPEMVNPDSDMFRAHPEWALTVPGYEPVLGRHQLVVDLANPEAFASIHAMLDALLRDHDIAFLKWDMNRDLVQAGAHAQTLAMYRLIDVLRAAHPDVEIESCASGGARIDLAVLERTERVWTSDCNDALERQTIQRWASTFIPPEVMGAHIGPPRAETTGRTQSLAFRAGTALFGHLGIEWNLLDLDDAQLAEVRQVIGLHKQHRALLHGGEVVRIDRNGDASLAHGVVAADGSEAMVALVQLRSAQHLAPDPLRVPGLRPDRRYRLRLLPLPGRAPRLVRQQPEIDGLVLTGRQLAVHGVQLPVLLPESLHLVHLASVE